MAFLLLAGGDPAQSQQKPDAGAAPVSQFTTLALAQCKRVGSDADGGRWTCKGLAGFDISFAEGDLRQFIAYGSAAKSQRAASQTLGPFNSVFKDARDVTTMEWRGRMEGGRFVPYATIIRYFTDSGRDSDAPARKGQVLVVARTGASNGTDACHVAYIDALANADANALAVKAADEQAPGFDCRKEPLVVGTTGRSPLKSESRI